jgi:hypothetical protein
MNKQDIIDGIKYIVKVGGTKSVVRVVKTEPSGNAWEVKDMNSQKTFSIKSIKCFLDFQNDKEKQKALVKMVKGAPSTLTMKKGDKFSVKIGKNLIPVEFIEKNESGFLVKNLSKGSEFIVKSEKSLLPTKEPKAADTKKTSVLKKQNIMGHSKCAFVKAMGQRGYKFFQVKKVLDKFEIPMPEKSVKIQIYFGKNEKTWAKFGKPAELTPEQIKEIEIIAQ